MALKKRKHTTKKKQSRSVEEIEKMSGQRAIERGLSLVKGSERKRRIRDILSKKGVKISLKAKTDKLLKKERRKTKTCVEAQGATAQFSLFVSKFSRYMTQVDFQRDRIYSSTRSESI